MVLYGTIRLFKGCKGLVFDSSIIFSKFVFAVSQVPPNWIECKEKRDGDDFHLTVITSQEINLISGDINAIFSKYNQSPIQVDVLGLGKNSNSYYLVCVSAQLDNLRQELGLDSKDFHITLGFNQTDSHDIPKDIDTIIKPEQDLIDLAIKNLSSNTGKNIKLLSQLDKLYPENFKIIKSLVSELSKKSKFEQALNYSMLLFDLFPNNMISSFLLLKLFAFTESCDLNILKSIYKNITQIQNKANFDITSQVVKLLNDLTIQYKILDSTDNLETINNLENEQNEESNTNWFKLFGLNELTGQIESVLFKGNFDYNLLLNVQNKNIPQTKYLDNFIKELNFQLITTHTNLNKNIRIYLKSDELENVYVKEELPGNFSQVSNVLYGSAMVSSKYIRTIHSLGINTIVNLIGEEKPKEEVKELCVKYNIKLFHLGFTDRSACSFELYLKIQEIIENPSNITLIHCVGGIGRTNMVLAGYLMKHSNIPPSEAIAILKDSRKVNMVPDQVMFLKKYYSHLLNLISGSTNTNKTLPFKGLVVMVGLPCSGKSTLALEIFTKFSSMTNDIVHINQDEIGKSACEELLSSKAKSADLIILDRCNPLSTDRANWINLYKQLVNNKVYVIFMNLGLDISLERLKTRQNHLTLGQTGDKIIIDMSKKMTIPNKKEGFDELIQINNLDELNRFKNKIGLDVKKEEILNKQESDINLDKIIKFPRTKHLANLGAMARDDLLMDKTDIEIMLKSEVTVEEKVDGGNLGFRLGSDGKILVQNRSHYVSSSYHPQFKKLDQWVENKKADLLSILTQGNYIIYGEWLYSKHSINYTKLPDYFIMFDLYDIDSNSFFSRDYIEKLISNTSITLVPLIYRGKATLDKLKSLVQTESKFYPGTIEGIYIRCFEPNSNKLKLRGKIVRSDFICGDEHWTKGKQTLNTLA